MCSTSTSRCRIFFISALALFAVWMFFTYLSGSSTNKNSFSVGASNLTSDNLKSSYINRRLLDGAVSERIGEACSKEDIQVYQAPTVPMPNGITTYTVLIINACEKGCPIGGIHLTCGWFSSALMIYPKIFKRLKHDCLVNDGQPLKAGGSLTFQYANTYSYPLAVASVECP